MFSFKMFVLVFAIFQLAYAFPAYDDLDLEGAASEHGRVQIKVFRGPSEHHGFAPWGYWVKQPADDHH